ncbi:hypothetical protein AVCANL279_01465 [Campylobacter canadensis]|uniref:hypothetical protein n=1 Tax=Campylobacter canadensis TaxID=449520 RepID=UPI0015578103|nr:hypothetical protein [Campylobacter canadensis]MBZ7994303.1 hypothetical protein [Campylobacter canadensis]MBZ7995999.1 hypothetical protein [Campylobacter canadensis]MBZ7999635.1 hypothetical protein [Campylobacter canadensis]MBZ8001430.1 hypothetical protein [Campylobacter canadensis]MBZ8003995.1 hypothetical protein [Campylobacter canadensis]
MKNFLKGLSLGILLLVFFLFGLVSTKAIEYFTKDNSSSIESEIEVLKEIEFDLFSAKIKISESAFLSKDKDYNDKEKIEDIFSNISALLKESKICYGGSYELNPNYSYKDGLRSKEGYKINSIISCTFAKNDLEKYRNLLNNLDELANKDNLIVINSPLLEPNLSAAKIKESEEILNQMLKEKLDEKLVFYSEFSKKTCKFAKISIFSDLNINNTPVMLLKASADVNAQPALKSMSKKMQAQFVLKCI